MVDVINNVIAVRINSRDRINISDSTTDFTVALRKSLRNIAGVNVAGVVIPRNDTLVGPNNDTITGTIYIDNVVNPFSMNITKTNYTASTLATELQTKFNANVDMISYDITFAVSYIPLINRMNIVATYPAGATHTWSISIDYSNLRDVVGIGIAGTTTQSFTAAAGSTTLDITCTRAPILTRALTYNITSDVLSNGINTSYISSLGKLFQITSSNNVINFENQLSAGNTIVDLPLIPSTQSVLNPSLSMVGRSVSISVSGLTMAVGSSKYGVFVFTRASSISDWVMMGTGPVQNELTLYNGQGFNVALSGDASYLAFSSNIVTYIYIRSGDTWLLSFSGPSTPLGGSSLSFNNDGSTLVIGYSATAPGSVNILTRVGDVWSLQALAPPVGSVAFGSSVKVSSANVLVTCDKQFGSVVAYTYLKTGGVWALQQTIVPGTAVGGFIDDVAISGFGNYLAISSSTDNAGVGATWIYIWTGVTWSLQQKITVASTSIALNTAGDTLVIGASSGNGKVNVYKRSGALWSAELTDYVGIGGSNSNQGFDVAIDGLGDNIIWGGPADPGTYGPNQGAVWSAHRSVATWTEVGTKITSYTGVVRSLGSVIAMSGDGLTMAESAGVENPTGYVAIFVLNGLTWTLQHAMPGIISSSYFGVSMSFSDDGNVLAIGTYTKGTYVYTRTNGVWTQQTYINHPQPSGGSIALNGAGDTLAICISSPFGGGVLIWNKSHGVWSETTYIGSGLFAGQDVRTVDMDRVGTTIIMSYPGEGAVPFSLIDGLWTQMGPNFKTFYTPVVGNIGFGDMGVISADGLIIAVSDRSDDAGTGAIFIFRFISGSWVQSATVQGSQIGIGLNFQGASIRFINNGNTLLFGSDISTNSDSGAIWVFNYNGITWNQVTTYNPGPQYWGFAITGQRTGSKFAGGSRLSSGNIVEKVHVFSEPGEYFLTNSITIPDGFYSVFDLVNQLTNIMTAVIPSGTLTSAAGYSVSFDGSRLTIIPVLAGSITKILFRVLATSTFDVARWPSLDYKTSQISNPVVFAINNNVIKSITNHSDNSDNVLVDNTPDTPYRKYPAGYTIDAGTPIDIQLRNDRDQIIDLNGSDWVMTVYATVRS